MDDLDITHIIVAEVSRLSHIRSELSKLLISRIIYWLRRRSSKLPRVVTPRWVSDSVKELTRLDESRYAP